MRWRAVYTKANTEKGTSERLQKRLGVVVFFPFVRETVRQKQGRFHRIKTVERPYFSRYLFAYDVDRHLPYVKGIEGVSCIVSDIYGAALEIPGGVIRELQSLADEEGCMGERDFSRPWLASSIEVGDRFVINSPKHVFHGLIGQLSSVASLGKRGEISAFVRIFGAEREISLPASAVGEVLSKASSLGLSKGTL
jgi:hypothetical protein